MTAPQPTRVALYARVSSLKQEREGTIASQIDAIQKYAAAQGWTETKLYADDGYSGITLQRPALDALLMDAREGRIARVVALDPDRLSRDAIYGQVLSDELESYGVPVVYVEYTPDDSDEGKFMAHVLKGVKQYERAKILSRTRRGRLHRVQQGLLWRGTRPYGWSYTKPDHPGQRGTLARVEEEAAITREMVRRVIGGETAHAIAYDLNRRGLRTTRRCSSS